MTNPYKFRRTRSVFSYTTHSSLLRRVKSGDDKAWRDFYDRYAGMIRAIGKRRSLSPSECDELLTDVMVIFWKKMESFTYDRRRGRFRSYLGCIANFAVRKLRDRENRAAAPLPAAPEPEYPDEIDRACMEEWRDFLLNSAMEELKNRVDTEVWQTFHMMIIQHRSVKEIAEITRRTPNNIYIIRHRCLNKLREIIADYRRRGDSELALHSQRKNGAN